MNPSQTPEQWGYAVCVPLLGGRKIISMAVAAGVGTGGRPRWTLKGWGRLASSKPQSPTSDEALRRSLYLPTRYHAIFKEFYTWSEWGI